MKIFNLLFPKRCIICQSYMDNNSQDYICQECRNSKDIIKIMPKFPKMMFVDDKIAAAFYRNKVRKSVHRFKFNRKIGYGKGYALELKKQYILENLNYDMITFVPSNRWTVFKRGYNQAQVLAKEFAKIIGLPCENLIVKKRKTKPMYKIESVSERRANVLSAYKLCKNSEIIKDKSILIVDDICTTGATLTEISKVLKINGAKKVGCAVFAHKK